MSIQVHKLNDTDWWMAPTLEQAIQDAKPFYAGLGLNLSDDELFDSPRTLTDDDLKNLEYDKGGSMCTFEEELNRRVAAGKVSEFFATSEY